MERERYITWYRTPGNAKDKDTSGFEYFAYRAIQWDKEKSKYVLISGRRDPGYDGDTDITQIEFENPKVLAHAIVALRIEGWVPLIARGTVTKTHTEGDRDGLRSTHSPDTVQTGDVCIQLQVEHGVLIEFESTVHVVPE
jgi:hypothetical protein